MAIAVEYYSYYLPHCFKKLPTKGYPFEEAVEVNSFLTDDSARSSFGHCRLRSDCIKCAV